MRIAVITGLLACTLVFGINTKSSHALPLEELNEIQNSSNSSNVEVLLALADENPLEGSNLPEKTDEVPVEPTIIKHKVIENESLSEIAKKYETEWKRLYDKNVELESPDIINPGEEIVIPSVDEKIEPRALPVIVAPVPVKQAVKPAVKQSVAQAAPAVRANRGSSNGNGYVAGYCTWYVKSLRPDLPNNLGNASTWVSRAAAQGMPTGSTPRVGAVAQRNNHVAYVTGVNGDGTINITEMNYRALYQETNRTVPANQWSFVY